MGELLRRYWMPIGGASELEKNPIKPMRLMAEDLVLYRDQSGRFGLLDRHCPHRRADLSYGFVEETGIRCNYHGWLIDQGLSGEGMRGPVVDLYGAAADAGPAGVGAVHVGERLSRDRALRRSLQLVPVPGELLRPRTLRVDARQLDPSPERQGRSLRRQAPQAQVRGIRLRLRLQAGARGLRRA